MRYLYFVILNLQINFIFFSFKIFRYLPPTETFATAGQKGYDNFNSNDMVIVFITIYLMEHLFSGKLELNIKIMNVENL